MVANEAELAALLGAVKEHSSKFGCELLQDASTACKRTLAWTHYFRTSKDTRCATELLNGTQTAILETAAYVSLGLGCAAITAIRLQIDLLLGFTYFCDHPQEWNYVIRTGEGFMLRSDVQKYHNAVTEGFGKRLMMIEQSSKVSLQRAYGQLSAHIHGQSPFTIPKVRKMSELVFNKSYLSSVIALQKKTDMALSNYLCALYAVQWADLPVEIVTEVRTTLTEKQRAEFFV